MARDVLGEKIAQFIPAHPIAGSEMNGPEAAVDDLFVGKKAVIAALPENSRPMWNDWPTSGNGVVPSSII